MVAIRRNQFLAALSALFVAAASAASAQTYPTRPVTLIVPFAPGAAADSTARIVGEAMRPSLGQTVVVENMPGAGGTIGTLRAKRAPPDGYTIVFGHVGTQAAAVSLYPALGYDPRVDFEPLGLVASAPILLYARKDFPASNLREFIAYARTRGPALNAAHNGAGSIPHLSCAMLASIGGFTPTYVPYRGTGPVMNDMMGGNVDYSCDILSSVSQQVAAGALKGIVLAGPVRSPAVPAVETAVEAGAPDFQVKAWIGFFAPKGTPPEVLAALRAAVSAALDDPRTRARLAELGSDLPSLEERRPDYLASLVASEIERWGKVIREQGITAAP
ncbi:MAG: tripartite tricarboxylate transporter substrate binding protein BugD [Rhizobiales bacterium]|nr:tripartite tricarboxylate transporter substrate binding protein BugD [Hyphomicrobiales bacterium]